MSQSGCSVRGHRRESTGTAGTLLKQLEELGWRGALVRLRKLYELCDEIEGRQKRGEFAPELYQERYTIFDFGVSTADSGARSILIVAAFQPHVRLTVTISGRQVPVIIPPTYSTRIDKEVESLVKATLTPLGYVVFRRSLPLKLLAVRSGLARYGRNNLAYVDGMGSYCRLLGFYTGLEVAGSSWVDPQRIAECENCTACVNNCPTGAIDRNRFLIRAERCLTFHNERRGSFPPDLQPESHHCLIGCLHCQSCCPVNRKVAGWIEPGGALAAHDTAILLDGGPAESLSDSGLRIMEEYAFTSDLPELARNLRALLATPGNVRAGLKLLPGTRDGEQDNVG